VAQQVARRVEQQHRRRGLAAFRFRRGQFGGALARRQRERPLHHPDTIVFVGRDAGDLAKDPVVRQRLRP